jgi:hypothetical protein
VRFYKENACVVSTIEKVELIFIRDLKLGLDCTCVPIVKDSQVRFTRFNRQDQSIQSLNNQRFFLSTDSQVSNKISQPINQNHVVDIVQILSMPIRGDKT